MKRSFDYLIMKSFSEVTINQRCPARARARLWCVREREREGGGEGGRERERERERERVWGDNYL